MATSALSIKKTKNKIIYDHDIQDFFGLDFKIKVETTNEDNNAKLLFYDKNNEIMPTPLWNI
ncbi:23628_t:CDS:1, partial [Cetraspora pellucida]